jgi:hypothetical protein
VGSGLLEQSYSGRKMGSWVSLMSVGGKTLGCKICSYLEPTFFLKKVLHLKNIFQSVGLTELREIQKMHGTKNDQTCLF